MNSTNPQRDYPLVLVVDDDMRMRLLLCQAMKESGYQVEEASDGEQALVSYQRLHPDIVLLDAVMPVMDGFTCCRQLRSLPGGDRTPILMITRLEDEASVNLAFDAGATEFITKPINWAVLRQRVRHLLQASRVTAELRQQTKRAQASEEQLRLALEVANIAKAEAEASRNQVTNILESITDGFFALDDQWRFTYLNQQAEHLLQRTRADLLGKNVWDEFPETVGTVFYQEYHKAVLQRVSVQFEEFYPPLNAWFAVHAYPGKNGLSVYFQNITERKLSEEELQRQHLRSQLFADITLKIRQSLQLNEILQTTVNEIQKFLQADRMLIFRLWPNGSGTVLTEAVVPGWPAVVGQNILDPCFREGYIQKYQHGRISSITDITQGNIHPCHVEFLQKYEVKANLVVPIFLKQQLWGLLIAHQCASPRQWNSFETELLLQLSDQIGIALAQAQMLAEETRYSQELARSNTDLQQFASIASHDLQEPLRKIQAFGNRLKTIYGDALTEQGRDYLERMQSAAQRMQALIDDLLILSRITTRTQPFVTVNLNSVTQEVLSDLEVKLQQTGGQVEVGDLRTIDADPVQMRQLIQNLLSNALKFHRDGEVPFVKIYSQLLDREQRQVENSEMATLCRIIVEDNGIGFDKKYLNRIFNVFQRLHGRSEYEGTGIGLAICRKIAERHRGSITAESTPGKGAIFIVTLPIEQRRGDSPQ